MNNIRFIVLEVTHTIQNILKIAQIVSNSWNLILLRRRNLLLRFIQWLRISIIIIRRNSWFRLRLLLWLSTFLLLWRIIILLKWHGVIVLFYLKRFNIRFCYLVKRFDILLLHIFPEIFLKILCKFIREIPKSSNLILICQRQNRVKSSLWIMIT